MPSWFPTKNLSIDLFPKSGTEILPCVSDVQIDNSGENIASSQQLYFLDIMWSIIGLLTYLIYKLDRNGKCVYM